MEDQILERNKKAAEMLLSSKYPEDVLLQMKALYKGGDYQSVQSIASDYDSLKRRQLADKITMLKNPNFKPPPTIEELNQQVVANFFCENQPVDKDAHSHCQFLFKAAGIDDIFESASEAATAYKNANGEATKKQPNFRLSVCEKTDGVWKAEPIAAKNEP